MTEKLKTDKTHIKTCLNLRFRVSSKWVSDIDTVQGTRTPCSTYTVKLNPLGPNTLPSIHLTYSRALSTAHIPFEMNSEEGKVKNVTKLIVVRHGQSTWNVERRWQGQADAPLTALGEAQAAEAARNLGAVDAIVTSTLQRARHTGQIIGEHVGCGSIVELEDLQERSVGKWEGLLHTEIEAQYPGWMARGKKPDGYENSDAVRTRAKRGLFEVAQRYPGATVVVVTHGGVQRILDRIFGPLADRYPNLHGRVFLVSEGELSPGERLTPTSDMNTKSNVL